MPYLYAHRHHNMCYRERERKKKLHAGTPWRRSMSISTVCWRQCRSKISSPKSQPNCSSGLPALSGVTSFNSLFLFFPLSKKRKFLVPFMVITVTTQNVHVRRKKNISSNVVYAVKQFASMSEI